jgi:hypothetical protein
MPPRVRVLSGHDFTKLVEDEPHVRGANHDSDIGVFGRPLLGSPQHDAVIRELYLASLVRVADTDDDIPMTGEIFSQSGSLFTIEREAGRIDNDRISLAMLFDRRTLTCMRHWE